MDDSNFANDWLESWAGSVNAQAAHAVELSRRVAGLTGVAQSPDEAIRVTVGSAGQVEDLQLDDSVGRLGGRELARRVMSVMRAAQADLSAQVGREVEVTVGADSATGRAVVHSFETRFPGLPDDQTVAGARDGR